MHKGVGLELPTEGELPQMGEGQEEAMAMAGVIHPLMEVTFKNGAMQRCEGNTLTQSLASCDP